MSVMLRRRVSGPSGDLVITPPSPPASGSYPLLGTIRISTWNYTQSGALAATDRIAIGLMDAVHLGGFFGVGGQDDADPGANFISRTEITQEILDAHFDAFGNNDIYIFTYVNQMEGSEYATKIEAETGPNGTDWWFRNSGGNIAAGFFGNLINLTDQITTDSEGRGYAQYYADVRVITELMDVHAAAGIAAGQGGMSPYYDNLFREGTKSAIDPDQNGTNNDMQDYYDPDNAAHMSGNDAYGALRSQAVQFIGEARGNQRDGLERVKVAYPDVILAGNSNEYNNGYSGVATNLPYMMKEYRLDPDDTTSKGFQQSGFSENNNWTPSEEKDGYQRSHTLWTGVSSDNGNQWQESYNNIAMPTWSMTAPAIHLGEWIVDCLQSGTNGPASNKIYPAAPQSSSAWNAHRWGMITCWLAGSHYCCSGVIDKPTNTEGERRATVLMDEFGLINGANDYGFGTGTSKLSYKWMGEAVDAAQTGARTGWLWWREFDNALIIINTNWDDSDPDETVDVSTLPGGASEWTRFIGTQDATWNDGTDASSDFDIPSIDGIVLVRKSYYDAA